MGGGVRQKTDLQCHVLFEWSLLQNVANMGAQVFRIRSTLKVIPVPVWYLAEINSDDVDVRLRRKVSFNQELNINMRMKLGCHIPFMHTFTALNRILL